MSTRWKTAGSRCCLFADKWLACYPSLCYQRPGFSDIEKKITDNISYYYFNKLP